MKKYLIGISGSISAYKSILLIRELSKSGHDCKVVITKGGLDFVTPQLVAGLGFEVFTDDSLDLTNPDTAMAHIDLAKWADEILLIPASANLIAKIAGGFADDLLTQTLLVADDKSKIIAPAMNTHMWNNKITIRNVATLQDLGYTFIGPDNGLQACGDVGSGRLLEVDDILTYLQITHSNALHGKTILISLGATIEDIDGVRYLSNYSSGKMGSALIYAALANGATVIAIAAKINVTLPSHTNLQVHHATDTQSMFDLVMKYATHSDVFISCAAVSDYKIKDHFPSKIKKDSDTLSLELVKNPDILANCVQKFPKLLCIGFAAETNDLVKYASDKLKRKNLALIIANHINVFGKDSSKVVIIDKNNDVEEIDTTSKNIIASRIIEKTINLISA